MVMTEYYLNKMINRIKQDLWFCAHDHPNPTIEKQTYDHLVANLEDELLWAKKKLREK